MDCYVALGSNLGELGENLHAGLEGLRRSGLIPEAVSSVWETEPVDTPFPQWFWNMAVLVRSDRPPRGTAGPAPRDRAGQRPPPFRAQCATHAGPGPAHGRPVDDRRREDSTAPSPHVGAPLRSRAAGGDRSRAAQPRQRTHGPGGMPEHPGSRRGQAAWRSCQLSGRPSIIRPAGRSAPDS